MQSGRRPAGGPGKPRGLGRVARQLPELVTQVLEGRQGGSAGPRRLRLQHRRGHARGLGRGLGPQRWQRCQPPGRLAAARRRGGVRGCPAAGVAGPVRRRVRCDPARPGGGAAGLDGWEASELRGLLTWAPWAIGELHGLLVRTTEAAAAGGIPAAVRDRLHAWRIVGIPKRLSEQLRPIAVGSCITRAWHRTLVPVLPGPPLGQWCGRKGVSVVAATASWLSAPAVAVA